MKPGGTFILSDVAKDSAVALFLDEYVGAYNSTGHEGSFLDERTLDELAETSWKIAALRLGIPFVQLPDRAIEYGHGRHSRRMLDSLTDATPNLTVHLSRHKNYAAAILREAGIPVPSHLPVANVQEALQAAQSLGYPVVVKPADRDGGEAVSAGLQRPEEVREAYAKAVAASNKVLVEKHVPGRDYRVTVFQGRAIWVVERVHGGVTGDGRARVRELVNRVNADPRRQTGAYSALKPLVIDAEARKLLGRLGMTDESVPSSGQFVRLRGAANVASGGIPVAVFDQLHPDNAQLAVRAARALGADIAGVDLLIPDISRSWLETGAFICEVNPGPDIGQSTAAHLYEPILASLVAGDGRVPVVLVVAPRAGSPVERLIDDGLNADGMMIGYHDRHGVRVGDEWLARNPVGSFLAGHMLTRDRHVEAIVMRIDDGEVLTTGLPFQRIDMLVIAGNTLKGGDAASQNGSGPAMEELVASLLPACDGPVVILPEAGFDLDLSAVPGAVDLRTFITDEGLEEFLRQQIPERAGRHRAANPGAASFPGQHA